MPARSSKCIRTCAWVRRADASVLGAEQRSLYLPSVVGTICRTWCTMPLRCIPVEELFANPAIAQVSIAPDGRFLAWLAPRNGQLNIWLYDRTTGHGRFLTDQRDRSIHAFAWGNARTIVFARDTNGDENYQLYLLDVLSDEPPRLCTPPEGVRAEILSTFRFGRTASWSHTTAGNGKSSTSMHSI